MNIDTLKGLVTRRSGLARSNRFEILVVPPRQAFGDVQEIRDLNILCDATSLPGRQMQTFETNYTRQQVKVVQSFINEDVSFTFNLTNDMFIKKMFDKWTDMIIDRRTFKKNYDSVYKRDVAIYQNNIQNERVYGVKLINAFPISVQAVELNSSEGEVQKLTVEFTYEDFEELTIQKNFFNRD